MNTQHILQPLKAMLTDIALSKDTVKLAECLSGLHLPAIGGNFHPAEVLYNALTIPPLDKNLTHNITKLLANVCQERVQTLASMHALHALEEQQAVSAGEVSITTSSSSSDLLNDEPYVFNLFLFASYLPAEEKLFSALKSFYNLGLSLGVLLKGQGRAGRELRQALIYQQTDDSLEQLWLDQISIFNNRQTLQSYEHTELMAAWTGLIWIPPASDAREMGETLNISRIATGLEALYNAVSSTTDVVNIMRPAVRQLDEAYPRSPEFWREQLTPYYDSWPELLRDITTEFWPIFDTEEHLDIPKALKLIWETFNLQERTEINNILEQSDAHAWKSLWDKMLFDNPRNSFSRQQWGADLKALKKHFEKTTPEMNGGRKSVV